MHATAAAMTRRRDGDAGVTGWCLASGLARRGRAAGRRPGAPWSCTATSARRGACARAKSGWSLRRRRPGPARRARRRARSPRGARAAAADATKRRDTVGVPAPAPQQVPDGFTPGTRPQAGMAVDRRARAGVAVEVEGVGRARSAPGPTAGRTPKRVCSQSTTPLTRRPERRMLPHQKSPCATCAASSSPHALSRATAYLRCRSAQASSGQRLDSSAPRELGLGPRPGPRRRAARRATPPPRRSRPRRRDAGRCGASGGSRPRAGARARPSSRATSRRRCRAAQPHAGPCRRRARGRARRGARARRPRRAPTARRRASGRPSPPGRASSPRAASP